MRQTVKVNKGFAKEIVELYTIIIPSSELLLVNAR